MYRRAATSRDVYLPPGDWYDWWTNAKSSGGRTITRDVDLATMPIFVRAGAIVPVDPVRQYTNQPVTEPTTIRVYRGADGDFVLYDDDGVSQEYLANQSTWTRLTWKEASRRLVIEPGTPPGAPTLPVRRDFRVLVLPDGLSRSVTYTGSKVTVAIP